MNPIGDGPLKSVGHPHFWKAAFLFIIIIGGLWAWYYFKIRHAVRVENDLEQRAAAGAVHNPGAILPN